MPEIRRSYAFLLNAQLARPKSGAKPSDFWFQISGFPISDFWFLIGAIAQLGERVNGIHEVGGSIPPGSTISLDLDRLTGARFSGSGSTLLGR